MMIDEEKLKKLYTMKQMEEIFDLTRWGIN